MKEDRLLDVAEVSKRLKVKPGWIYENRYKGTLPFPFLKIRSQLRFKKSDIDRYIDRQTKASN